MDWRIDAKAQTAVVFTKNLSLFRKHFQNEKICIIDTRKRAFGVGREEEIVGGVGRGPDAFITAYFVLRDQFLREPYFARERDGLAGPDL